MKFTPPSIEDAIGYASEIALPASEAEWFHDHFTANGWRVGGKSPMKDWKAALRLWWRRWKARNGPQTSQDARGGVFPARESVWALTERRKALEAEMARLSYRSRHEGPMGVEWSNMEDRAAYIALKKNLEELNKKIAGL